MRRINKIERKFKLLGLKVNYKVFNYMRIISTFILFLWLLFLSPYGYFVSPICSLFYYFFLEYIILDCGIRRRCKLLENQAYDFFSVFNLLLKNGNNIKRSLNMTVSVIDNDLSNEFKSSLSTIRNGKLLEEALIELKDRIPSILIANMVVNMIEGNKYGISIDESINSQLNVLQNRKNNSIINYYKLIPYKVAFGCLIVGFLLIAVIILFSLGI